ncbi:hypothetical protein HDZ31DRAFT_69880 [Schizophyllum fasciatum]
MASVFPVVFWLAIVAALMVCAALFTPKGPQQVIMLALASCYLMWMITYMAQLHPLISPIRSVSQEA